MSFSLTAIFKPVIKHTIERLSYPSIAGNIICRYISKETNVPLKHEKALSQRAKRNTINHSMTNVRVGQYQHKEVPNVLKEYEVAAEYYEAEINEQKAEIIRDSERAQREYEMELYDETVLDDEAARKKREKKEDPIADINYELRKKLKEIENEECLRFILSNQRRQEPITAENMDERIYDAIIYPVSYDYSVSELIQNHVDWNKALEESIKNRQVPVYVEAMKEIEKIKGGKQEENKVLAFKMAIEERCDSTFYGTKKVLRVAARPRAEARITEILRIKERKSTMKRVKRERLLAKKNNLWKESC